MTGIELEASARTGDEGLELAGVVGVDSTSPPSPSLSIAESSTNKNFLLLGSTTKECVRKWRKEEEKEKGEEKKNLLVSVREKKIRQVPGTERKEPREPERSEGELGSTGR